MSKFVEASGKPVCFRGHEFVSGGTCETSLLGSISRGKL